MRTKRALALTAALVTAAALTACSSSSGSTADDPAGDAPEASTEFPITIEHAYGETVITEQPERVAAIGWSNAEAVIALGVVPVGMDTQTYGDDDGDGVLPWTSDALDALGGDAPVLFDTTDGIDFEGISDAAPDVIVAALSGVTQEEYETLSEIAPTVPFPGLSWATSWRDTILTNAQGIGLPAEGEQLVADLEATIAEGVAAHPQIEGLTAAWTYINPTDFGTVGVYTTIDSRAAYLEDLGLVHAPSVVALSKGVETFYVDISAENVDQLDDVDVLFSYGTADLLEQLQADPLLGTIPAVERGSVVFIEDGTPLASAVSPPSALSLEWGLDEYLGLIAAAADKVE
ncbi:iron-siderophore ABC transporter substrate-binding protein [Microbacterium terricola]|uniref:iron-siderophore ABC transporter substrate-binding protein n=1 Tax=Microbacterium terricola TaxID=344163 RepID=UPI0021E80C2A|nr:iron-siderophore ABC transporter substrate-binding protein [Microbacterium terricola]UYK41368.1 iron-siderophore ABC transporter substrate-binding protein [Microbacterium terricola]